MTRDPIDEKKNIDRPIARLSLPKAMLSDECAIKDCANCKQRYTGTSYQSAEGRALKRRVKSPWIRYRVYRVKNGTQSGDVGDCAKTDPAIQVSP